jgi:tetratricopeptide (TPR) repeat protein
LYDKAEECFIKSLEADPNQYMCLSEYASFLAALGNDEDSEKFFQRAKHFAVKV